jgi:multidrug efflux pump subunit AcrA (membrane-fusion protein)
VTFSSPPSHHPPMTDTTAPILSPMPNTDQAGPTEMITEHELSEMQARYAALPSATWDEVRRLIASHRQLQAELDQTQISLRYAQIALREEKDHVAIKTNQQLEAERRAAIAEDRLSTMGEELERAKSVLGEAYELLNRMGDTLNAMDAVEEADEAFAVPIFARMRQALGKTHPSDLPHLASHPQGGR